MKHRILALILFVCTGSWALFGCGGGGKHETSTPAESYQLATNDLLAVYNTSPRNTCTFRLSGGSGTVGQAAGATSATRALSRSERFYTSLREQGQLLTAKYGLPRHVVTRALPVAPTVGSSKTFHMLAYTNYDASGYIDVTATLKSIGRTCYIYVDNRLLNNDSVDKVDDTLIDKLRTQWETVIYPSDARYFGDPSDVDGDGHINILLSHFPDFADPDTYISGFFNPTDLYQWDNHSNNCEILYYNTETFQHERAEDFGTLVHELQHLINYHYRGGAEWISVNEGLSELAIDLAGYGLLDRTSDALYQKIQVYELDPSQYTAMMRDGDFTIGHYAAAYLLMSYLYDHYGERAIRAMVTQNTDKFGPDNIAAATGVPAEQLFHDWVIANIMDSMGWQTNYTYTSVHLKGTVDPTLAPLPGIPVTPLPASTQPTTLVPWTMKYYQAPQNMSCALIPVINGESLKGVHLQAEE